MRIANMLGALAGAIVERIDSPLKDHPNQTGSAAAALNIIAANAGCSNGELSATLKLSHPATVRVVDRLVASGMVERRTADDRRAVSLFLTTAGRQRVRAMVEGRCRSLHGIVQLLAPSQQRQLEAIAETLLRALTISASEGMHICRLCDEVACPPELCPVHQGHVGSEPGRSVGDGR